MECVKKWYTYHLESVLENKKRKFLQTDTEIEHRRPDIAIIVKEKRECKIIYIAVSGITKSTQRN